VHFVEKCGLFLRLEQPETTFALRPFLAAN